MSEGDSGDRRHVKINTQAFYKAQVRTGLSAAAIARKIGMNPQTVQRTAVGDTNPYLATLKQIADVLGVEVDSLIEHEDPGPRPGPEGEGPR